MVNASLDSSLGYQFTPPATKVKSRSRPASSAPGWAGSPERPITYFDERYTTVEAEQHLLEMNLTKKRRKARLDKLAAQIMLTAYLESTNRDSEPGAIDD